MSGMVIDREHATQGLAEAIRTMEAASDHLGCAWVSLAEDRRMRYVIVVGWADDGEGHDELRAKVARQPLDSAMQCDYDIDWEMPYDERTGEVWDTDVAVSSDDAWDQDWLVGQAGELARTGFRVRFVRQEAMS